MKIKAIILFWFFLEATFSEQLPSSFKKCNRKQADFNKCLATAVQDAINQLNDPIPEIGLPSLEPLQMPTLTIPAGKTAVLFEQNYKNFIMRGLSKGKVLKFEVNFKDKTINVECLVPEVRVEFDYDYNGKLFTIPIHGKGPGKIIGENVTFFLTFKLEEFEKQGKRYFKVVDTKLIQEPEGIKFEFDNLVRNDVNLGSEDDTDINKIFNDNWRPIYYDIRGGYQDFQALAYGALFNIILEKVPISQLFEN